MAGWRKVGKLGCARCGRPGRVDGSLCDLCSERLDLALSYSHDEADGPGKFDREVEDGISEEEWAENARAWRAFNEGPPGIVSIFGVNFYGSGG